jgi:hypothetical protein
MNTTDKSKKTTPRRTPKPPAEGVLDRLFAWLDLSLVRQAAGELARECHVAVWEATCETARKMSREEARGYIRAFAPEFLEKEVDLVLQRRRVRDSLRQRIMTEAADQLVELVIKDFYRTRSRKSASKAA